MKKILSFILGSIVALNLSISVANSAAKEVRVAFFLESVSYTHLTLPTNREV